MSLRCGALVLIGDVLFLRGLRFPANLCGSDAVVCRRSTSWTENAVPAPRHLTPRPAWPLMVAGLLVLTITVGG